MVFDYNLIKIIQDRNTSFKNNHQGSNTIATFSCILVLLQRYGHPKNSDQKISCNTFSIYIPLKN